MLEQWADAGFWAFLKRLQNDTGGEAGSHGKDISSGIKTSAHGRLALPADGTAGANCTPLFPSVKWGWRLAP